MTVWLAPQVTKLVELIMRAVMSVERRILHLRERVYQELGWIAPERHARRSLARQFICSGLVQDALVKTARIVDVPETRVIVNPDWNATLTPTQEARVLQETLPKHFAQSPHFDWVYLLIDGALKEDPTPTDKAEVESDPHKADQRAVCPRAVRSIQFALTGLLFTVFSASDPVVTFLEEESGVPAVWWGAGLLIAAGICGGLALWSSRLARRNLAIDPNIRGNSLTFWGAILGLVAVVVALSSLGLELSVLTGMAKVGLWVLLLLLVAGAVVSLAL
jgi:hypothetical protein